MILNTIKLPQNAVVLDLACGNGRHSVLFAQKGFKTLGIDLSEFLISEANKLLGKQYKKYRKNLSFEIKDMRKLSHQKEFNLVVNLFSSFGYFKKNSDNEKVIKSISNSLKPNGYFVLDFLNSNFIRNNLIPFNVKKLKDTTIYQIRTIKNNFVIKEIIIQNKAKRNVLRFTERIRLYTYKDFIQMFKRNGLKIIRKYGNYNGDKYDEKHSQRLIIFVKKESLY